MSDLMTPTDVAKYFGVHPKTVTKWADLGFLKCRRTMGGHRRFLREEVENFTYSPESMAVRMAALRQAK
jgi:excisionase family DNA binding protein